MGAKKKPAAAAEEPSRVAGFVVVAVLVAVVTGVVFAVSPTAGPLVVWGAGTVTLWWYVRRTANPAPPPPPERGSDENPQFTVVEDQPGHSAIHWREGADET